MFRESEAYKQQLTGAYNKGQDDISWTSYQPGWINESAMCKWYAERDAAKKAWE